MEQRSTFDVVYPAALAVVSVAAPYVIDAVKNAVKHDPGKHEEPPEK
jgi:hypothetical protein